MPLSSIKSRCCKLYFLCRRSLSGFADWGPATKKNGNSYGIFIRRSTVAFNRLSILYLVETNTVLQRKKTFYTKSLEDEEEDQYSGFTSNPNEVYASRLKMASSNGANKANIPQSQNHVKSSNGGQNQQGVWGPDVEITASKHITFTPDYQLKGGDIGPQNGVHSNEQKGKTADISVPLNPSKWSAPENEHVFKNWEGTDFAGGQVDRATQYDTKLESGTRINIFEIVVNKPAHTLLGYEQNRYYFTYDPQGQQWLQLNADPRSYLPASGEVFADVYGKFMATTLSIAFGMYIGAAVAAGDASTAAAAERAGLRQTLKLAGSNANLNLNQALSRYGIYEIKIDGKLYKYGKADLTRITQSSGQPTRLHQQLRALTKQFPGKRIVGNVIQDLGVTTTDYAKYVETQYIQTFYDQIGTVPLGNANSFKP